MAPLEGIINASMRQNSSMILPSILPFVLSALVLAFDLSLTTVIVNI